MNCPVDGTPLLMTERQGSEIDYCSFQPRKLPAYQVHSTRLDEKRYEFIKFAI
jgi:hypothetical protein